MNSLKGLARYYNKKIYEPTNRRSIRDRILKMSLAGAK
jgi:hypothetical protein